jgi:hypothetical protein
MFAVGLYTTRQRTNTTGLVVRHRRHHDRSGRDYGRLLPAAGAGDGRGAAISIHRDLLESSCA